MKMSQTVKYLDDIEYSITLTSVELYTMQKKQLSQSDWWGILISDYRCVYKE